MSVAVQLGSTVKADGIIAEIQQLFPHDLLVQPTADGMPSLWVDKAHLKELLKVCKHDLSAGFAMLYDLTAIDERVRAHREGQPASDFSMVFQLLSLQRNAFIRIIVALLGNTPSIDSICSLWENANWYERECHDMFGIGFDGHPNLYPLIMPPNWVGHPLRKEHPARATEMEPFSLSDEMQDAEQEALRFVPEQWGMKRSGKNTDFMFLNMGRDHTGIAIVLWAMFFPLYHSSGTWVVPFFRTMLGNVSIATRAAQKRNLLAFAGQRVFLRSCSGSKFPFQLPSLFLHA